MKSRATIVSPNPIAPCVKYSPLPFSRSLRSRSPLRSGHRTIVPVSQATHVIRRALISVRGTLKANERLYLSIVLMGIIAPLMSIAFLVFDKSTLDESWYYLNWYYLAITICPHLSMVIFYTGIFFLFPKGSSQSYFLTVPLALTVAKILWLITASSNEEVNQVVPFEFVAMGVVIAGLWLFAMTYITDRTYHRYDGICARIEGLFLSNMDKDQKLRLLEKEFRAIVEFKKS